MAIGPLARVLAQFAVVFGGAVARSVGNAYKEAAARGASNPGASNLRQAISGRMHPNEAAKILELEMSSLDKEKIMKRFQALHDANLLSPYLQRKVTNARTVLLENLRTQSTKGPGHGGDASK